MFTVNIFYNNNTIYGEYISKHFMFTVNKVVDKQNNNIIEISKHFMFTVNNRELADKIFLFIYFKTFHVYG